MLKSLWLRATLSPWKSEMWILGPIPSPKDQKLWGGSSNTFFLKQFAEYSGAVDGSQPWVHFRVVSTAHLTMSDCWEQWAGTSYFEKSPGMLKCGLLWKLRLWRFSAKWPGWMTGASSSWGILSSGVWLLFMLHLFNSVKLWLFACLKHLMVLIKNWMANSKSL